LNESHECNCGCSALVHHLSENYSLRHFSGIGYLENLPCPSVLLWTFIESKNLSIISVKITVSDTSSPLVTFRAFDTVSLRTYVSTCIMTKNLYLQNIPEQQDHPAFDVKARFGITFVSLWYKLVK